MERVDAAPRSLLADLTDAFRAARAKPQDQVTERFLPWARSPATMQEAQVAPPVLTPEYLASVRERTLAVRLIPRDPRGAAPSPSPQDSARAARVMAAQYKQDADLREAILGFLDPGGLVEAVGQQLGEAVAADIRKRIHATVGTIEDRLGMRRSFPDAVAVAPAGFSRNA